MILEWILLDSLSGIYVRSMANFAMLNLRVLSAILNQKEI
jgi:hypothetical protein